MKKSSKKTVLIITSHYPPNMGGVETHLQGLVNALLKRDWNIIISTYQPLAARKHAKTIEKNGNLIVYRAPWLGFNIFHRLAPYPFLEFLYLFPILFLSSIFVMFKHFGEIKVVHCQGLVPAAIGMLIRKIFKFRVISSIHNLYFYPSKGLYREAARAVFGSSDLVLGPTLLAQNELKSVGISEKKVSGFRYWLDLTKFKPIKKDVAKKELKWNKFTVFFVGRLIETKGVNELIKMMNNLNPKIQLVIAGDGPLRGEVEKASKRYPNLIYLGRIENYELPKYYSAADLLIVPSLVDEGWGFVAMEAISCGTPVLAAKKGGLSDVVHPSVGILVKPTSKDLKQSVEELYRNKNLLVELTSNTRKYSMKTFGENSVEMIIKAYESN